MNHVSNIRFNASSLGSTTSISQLGSLTTKDASVSGTALHVLECARRSGVHVDKKMYNAFLNALSRKTVKKHTSTPPRRTQASSFSLKLPPDAAKEKASIPSLGSWHTSESVSEHTAITRESSRVTPSRVPSLGEGPSPPPQRTKTPPRKPQTLSVPPLGEGPHVTVLSVAHSREKEKTTMHLAAGVDKRMHSLHSFMNHKGQWKSLELDLPLRRPPTSSSATVKVQAANSNQQAMGDQKLQTAAPSAELVASKSGVLSLEPFSSPKKASDKLPSSTRKKALIGGPDKNIRVAHLMDDPSLYKKEQPERAPVTGSDELASKLANISEEWKRRQDEEAKRQAEVLEQRQKMAEAMEYKRKLSLKNENWVKRRGLATKVKVKGLTGDLRDVVCGPLEGTALKTYQRLRASRDVSADCYRMLCCRLNRPKHLDMLADVLQEMEGSASSEINKIALRFRAGISLRIATLDRLLQFVDKMEKLKLSPSKNILRVLMRLYVTDNPVSGWQKAVEVYSKYKPLMRDPLCSMELYLLQAMSISIRGAQHQTRKSVILSLHDLLKTKMNEIGKLHHVALIRAYGSVRDSGAAHSILNRYKDIGEVDQTMYTALLPSCDADAIKEITSKLFSEPHPVESNLVASSMMSMTARQYPDEAWKIYRQACSHNEVPMHGAYLGHALVRSLQGAGITKENILETHKVLIRDGFYSHLNLTHMLQLLNQFQLYAESLDAVKHTPRIYWEAANSQALEAYMEAQKKSRGHIDSDIPVKKEALPTESDASPYSEKELLSIEPSKTEDLVTDDSTQLASEQKEKIHSYEQSLIECAKSRNWIQALDLLENLKETNTVLTGHHYNCAISAATTNIEIVDHLHKIMKSRNIPMNATTTNTIINSRLRVQLWEEALVSFEHSPVHLRDVSTYSMALNAISHSDSIWCAAIHVLREMAKHNVRPTTVSYSMALNSVHSHSWTAALAIVQSMSSSKGVELRPAVLSKLTKSLEAHDKGELIPQVTKWLVKGGGKKGNK